MLVDCVDSSEHLGARIRLLRRLLPLQQRFSGAQARQFCFETAAKHAALASAVCSFYADQGLPSEPALVLALIAFRPAYLG